MREFLNTHGVGIIISVIALCLLGAAGGIYAYGRNQATTDAKIADLRNEIEVLTQRQDDDDTYHEAHDIQIVAHDERIGRLVGMVEENTWGVKYINCWHAGHIAYLRSLQSQNNDIIDSIIASYNDAECVYDVPWVFDE